MKNETARNHRSINEQVPRGSRVSFANKERTTQMPVVKR